MCGIYCTLYILDVYNLFYANTIFIWLVLFPKWFSSLYKIHSRANTIDGCDEYYCTQISHKTRIYQSYDCAIFFFSLFLFISTNYIEHSLAIRERAIWTTTTTLVRWPNKQFFTFICWESQLLLLMMKLMLFARCVNWRRCILIKYSRTDRSWNNTELKIGWNVPLYIKYFVLAARSATSCRWCDMMMVHNMP